MAAQQSAFLPLFSPRLMPTELLRDAKLRGETQSRSGRAERDLASLLGRAAAERCDGSGSGWIVQDDLNARERGAHASAILSGWAIIPESIQL